MTVEERMSWHDRLTKKGPGSRPVVVPINSSVTATGYGPTALANEVAKVSQATEGVRNDTLNIAAFNLGQLIPTGHLGLEQITSELMAAALSCGLEPGESRDTIRSGITEGQKHPREVDDLVITGQVEEVNLGGIAVQPALEDTEGRPRTSWWPEPIGERASQAAAQPEPVYLVRSDGAALFYDGKVNGLIGESESGKSWVQQYAIAQAVKAGRRVLLLDFEDAPGGVMERLTLLGCTPAELALVDYANPEEALGLAQAEDLAEALGRHYDVIGLDGVNAAMTLLGYDINSNTDATKFTTKLLRPLAATGACVITVDHVPKNADARGKGGIGAQAKRAMMDGCCLVVEVLEPFGVGQNGVLKLKVDKDRPGRVRGVSAGSVHAGKVMLNSSAGAVEMYVTAPDLRSVEDRGPLRLTGLMEKVSRYLEPELAAVTTNDVVKAMGGRRDNVLTAITTLVTEGWCQAITGANRSRLLTSSRPYRQADDELSDVYRSSSDSVVPGGSPVVPGTGSASGSVVPLPFRGGPPLAVSAASPVVPADETSACNRCGAEVPDRIIAAGEGYCSVCARVVDQ